MTGVQTCALPIWLETTEKGGVRQSIRNCLTVFQRDPLLSGAIAYNILTDRKDIIKPIGFHRESTALNDTDMKYLLLYLEETYGLTNEKKIDNAIGIVANENKYHPIRDYLNTLVWDGTERIRFCLRHFLGADADDYTYEALKLFLLGAISRAFQPGCKFEIMLVNIFPDGAYPGKRRLCPPACNKIRFSCPNHSSVGTSGASFCQIGRAHV